MDTISKKEKEKIIRKILNSTDFQNSPRYSQLFQYLVDTSEQNEDPKETTIAIELFGKDGSFDPQTDPSIRVYISNLRKKLEHYFLTEGTEEDIRVGIPIGHYHLEFTKNKIKKRIVLNRSIAITMISMISIAVFVYASTKVNCNQTVNESNQLSVVWGDILDQKALPAMIILGDYYFLYENKQDGEGGYFVRDPMINSADDFKGLLKKNPNMIEKFVECNFTYLAPSAAESMTYILPILWQSNKKIYIKLASELKWEDVTQNNLIFIGSFKTLYILEELLNQMGMEYDISPPKLILKAKDRPDSLITYYAMKGSRKNYKKDYGVIIKGLGPEQNSIILMMGFDEIGITESVTAMTDINKITQITPYLESPYKDHVSFQMIIEVEGVERSVFRSEIVHFQELYK